jgi:hypothetical protein
MTKKLFISLVLCLSLLGAANPTLAQAGQTSGEDVLAQLQREGWKIVKDGVLQRELVPGHVESFVLGVPGFLWKIQDLQRQLRKLQAELRANPTPELRKAIANHRKAIANSRRALTLARTAEASGEEIDLSKVSCTINFSYDAAASYKTDVQGVTANSSATFGANCGGFSGQVYAYAFAKAWVNGAETTETVTDGPRSGANVSASAYASRNGGGPCESRAFGEMVSYSLNPSSYSKEVTNYSCPVPSTPLQVSVSSDWGSPIYLYDGDCAYITWTVSISGGVPGYTSNIYFNSSYVASGTTYSDWVCGTYANSNRTVTVRADVTDSIGQFKQGSHSTLVYSRVTTNTCGTVRCVEP